MHGEVLLSPHNREKVEVAMRPGSKLEGLPHFTG